MDGSFSSSSSSSSSSLSSSYSDYYSVKSFFRTSFLSSKGSLYFSVGSLPSQGVSVRQVDSKRLSLSESQDQKKSTQETRDLIKRDCFCTTSMDSVLIQNDVKEQEESFLDASRKEIYDSNIYDIITDYDTAEDFKENSDKKYKYSYVIKTTDKKENICKRIWNNRVVRVVTGVIAAVGISLGTIIPLSLYLSRNKSLEDNANSTLSSKNGYSTLPVNTLRYTASNSFLDTTEGMVPTQITEMLQTMEELPENVIISPDSEFVEYNDEALQQYENNTAINAQFNNTHTINNLIEFIKTQYYQKSFIMNTTQMQKVDDLIDFLETKMQTSFSDDVFKSTERKTYEDIALEHSDIIYNPLVKGSINQENKIKQFLDDLTIDQSTLQITNYLSASKNVFLTNIIEMLISEINIMSLPIDDEFLRFLSPVIHMVSAISQSYDMFLENGRCNDIVLTAKNELSFLTLYIKLRTEKKIPYNYDFLNKVFKTINILKSKIESTETYLKILQIKAVNYNKSLELVNFANYKKQENEVTLSDYIESIRCKKIFFSAEGCDTADESVMKKEFYQYLSNQNKKYIPFILWHSFPYIIATHSKKLAAKHANDLLSSMQNATDIISNVKRDIKDSFS